MTFSCVYSKDALKVKKFLKGIDKNSYVISYIDLTNKLSKNDVYQYEPNDSILSSTIFYLLNDYLLKSDESTKIFYVLSCLEDDVIFDLKDVVSEMYPDAFDFCLYSDEVNENLLFDKLINF